MHSLQVGRTRLIESGGSGEWWDREWSSSIFKEPYVGPVWLGYEGLAGDEQADRRFHGGVDKAVCVYPLEHYKYWQDYLGRELPFGALGENLTTVGLLEADVRVGDQFRLGDALIEVSQPREPCWKPARRWRCQEMTRLIVDTGQTGFYFRVLESGLVAAGQSIECVGRGSESWTIARCNDVMFRRDQNRESLEALSRYAPLAGSWKDALTARLRT